MYIVLIIKKIAYYILYIVFWFLEHIVSKRDIILMQTYNPQVYCDNTKYLFEYLSNNTDYDVFWITENSKIIEYLNENNFKYLDRSKKIDYLYSLYLVLKSKVIIDSGTKFFNPLNLKLDKTVKITTCHGNGPKTVVTKQETLNETMKELFDLNSFDYINFTSDFLIKKCGHMVYHIPNKKLINFGYPRCDQFFDSEYVQDRYIKKIITNDLLSNQYNGSGKIILYTPTWRPYKYNFPLLELKDLNNLEQLDQYFLDNDIYFFFTIHSAFNVPDWLPSRKRIKLIDSINQNPFYDTNSFMLEVDILINDYSTTTTDFAILNRPQIFFMPDFDKYETEKGFLDNYRSIIPGKEVANYKELTSTIEMILSNREKYQNEYNQLNKRYLIDYYDSKKGNSSALFTKLVHSIMNDQN